MRGILADTNVVAQANALLSIWTSDAWCDFWKTPTMLDTPANSLVGFLPPDQGRQKKRGRKVFRPRCSRGSWFLAQDAHLLRPVLVVAVAPSAMMARSWSVAPVCAVA